MATGAERHVVGIDLGTTNTVVAHASLTATGATIAVDDFAIPQLTAPSEIAALAQLPSAVYLPASGEFSSDALKLPWGRAHDVVGTFARAHGGKVPGRLITSAKSWLCVAGVDRNAPILPWVAAEGVEKRSPVDVQAELLGHVKGA